MSSPITGTIRCVRHCRALRTMAVRPAFRICCFHTCNVQRGRDDDRLFGRRRSDEIDEEEDDELSPLPLEARTVDRESRSDHGTQRNMRSPRRHDAVARTTERSFGRRSPSGGGGGTMTTKETELFTQIFDDLFNDRPSEPRRDEGPDSGTRGDAFARRDAHASTSRAARFPRPPAERAPDRRASRHDAQPDDGRSRPDPAAQFLSKYPELDRLVLRRPRPTYQAPDAGDLELGSPGAAADAPVKIAASDPDEAPARATPRYKRLRSELRAAARDSDLALGRWVQANVLRSLLDYHQTPAPRRDEQALQEAEEVYKIAPFLLADAMQSYTYDYREPAMAVALYESLWPVDTRADHSTTSAAPAAMAVTRGAVETAEVIVGARKATDYRALAHTARPATLHALLRARWALAGADLRVVDTVLDEARATGWASSAPVTSAGTGTGAGAALAGPDGGDGDGVRVGAEAGTRSILGSRPDGSGSEGDYMPFRLRNAARELLDNVDRACRGQPFVSRHGPSPATSGSRVYHSLLNQLPPPTDRPGNDSDYDSIGNGSDRERGGSGAQSRWQRLKIELDALDAAADAHTQSSGDARPQAAGSARRQQQIGQQGSLADAMA